jgi:hypothetical protein
MEDKEKDTRWKTECKKGTPVSRTRSTGPVQTEQKPVKRKRDSQCLIFRTAATVDVDSGILVEYDRARLLLQATHLEMVVGRDRVKSERAINDMVVKSSVCRV